MGWDLLANLLQGRDADAQAPTPTPTPPPLQLAPTPPAPTPTPIPSGLQEVYPNGTPGMLASNKSVGNPFAAGLMDESPDMDSLPAYPQPKASKSGSSSVFVPDAAPETTKLPQVNPLDQYKVTDEDLQDAANRKMGAKMIQGIAEPLANMQSWGNFFSGKMNPNVKVNDYSDLADQQVKNKQLLMKQAVQSNQDRTAMLKNQQDFDQMTAYQDPDSADSKYGKLILTRLNKEHNLGLDQKSIGDMNALQVGRVLSNPGVSDILASDKQTRLFAQQMALEDKKLENTRLMMGNRLAQGDERIHNQNLKDLTDNTYKSYLTSANNLQNAIANFQKGGATPQEFNELQQAVRSNAGIKGAGGVGEREETYLKSAGLDLAKAKQFLFGNPQSVLESDPAFAKQILGVAGLEVSNKKNQAAKYLDQKAAGHRAFYTRPGHEEIAKDYENALKAARDQIGLDPGQGGGEGSSDPLSKLGVDPSKMSEEQRTALQNQARMELIKRQKLAGK